MEIKFGVCLDVFVKWFKRCLVNAQKPKVVSIAAYIGVWHRNARIGFDGILVIILKM